MVGLKLNNFQIASRLPMQLEEESHEKLRKLLDVLCTLVAETTRASSVMISKRDRFRKTIQVRGSIGTMVKVLDMSYAIPDLDPIKSPTLAVPDVRLDSRFIDHPMLKISPHIRSFIAIMLPGFEQNERAILLIINPKRSVYGDASIWRELSSFTTVFASVLDLERDMTLIGELQPSDATTSGSQFEYDGIAPSQRTTSIVRAPMGSEANIDFLFDTLLKKRTLHSRNGIDYLTLRNWRSQVKSYQISTLVSLKANKPTDFIQRAALEIADAVRHVYGEGVIRTVVPIPPGSSGDANSFSVMLAQEIAIELNVTFCNALESQGQRGKSAPIKSAKLKPYSLKETVTGPILIIDDVASSGAHMELAIKALQQHSKAVYGVAWIGK
jgi:hypoxanthine-guanine phosphoribosyltransferase